MSKAIENLEAAQRQAMAIRPKVGGFPYLAEALCEYPAVFKFLDDLD